MHLDAIIPKEYFEEFIQFIRTFDKTHKGCNFNLTTDDPSMTVEEAKEILSRVKPPFPYQAIKQKGNA